MKYSMQIYYGALLTVKGEDKAIYSIGSVFTDNSLLPNQEWFDNLEGLYISRLVKKIEKDGFNPDDFWYDYITEKQYEESLDMTDSEKIMAW